ncbi:AAA family ATPase [Proteus mirabilis]|uniref:AAA family ATPase n=1 Tax=Proteus TaxID=583 RepID=UPI000F5C7213|nr:MULTISPECIES: AAA family ATPase [Proteus]EGT3592834.1 AAA family ATPase [Proteus mirabilis]EKU0763296.1 AAA family ATPase [Proteus mirabilis]EKX9206954.1 AAA family ATPase [Proteus mirabilis]ELB1207761.1 AAA family ATPase [Proteus mirabilis]EMA4723710.1 AAA family ATPase [Proteus mirabilis]
MSMTLEQIASQLKDANKKVQLIYAFNGTGKTRLSRAFKQLIAPKNSEDEEQDNIELSRNKFLYYNAFSEDLFYWDNDLTNDTESKLKIQPNTFTDWILKERGQDQNIIANFQRYTDTKLTPNFVEEVRQINQDGRRINSSTFSEVIFSYFGADERTDGIKISKGEESNFIWSVFYTLFQEVTSILNDSDTDDLFDSLEYIFIDDPVSSLDDTHLIEVAVDLAELIKNSAYIDNNGLKFIITTHNPLFYNVLHNELNNDLKKLSQDGTLLHNYKRAQSIKYRLDKKTDGTFELLTSNDHPFSYHLFLLSEINKAIQTNQIKKYHFNFLRNILEKTSTFLGYPHWEDLLENSEENAMKQLSKRIINLSSHSAHSGEEITDIEESDKLKLRELVTYLIDNYGFKI